jgi:hypothetical protein
MNAITSFSDQEFYRCGMRGISAQVDPRYQAIMEKLFEENQYLANYIGKIGVYHMEPGELFHGTPKLLGYSYGLTYEGIREILKRLGFEDHVADTKERLEELILTTTDQRAIITDEGILNFGTFSGHAISVFIEKKEPGFRIYINDSQGNAYFNHLSIPNLQLIISQVERQKTGEKTCNAFAIRDYIVFQKNPNILRKTEKINGGFNYIDEVNIFSLPKEMLTLNHSYLAKREALDYQLMLIRNQKVVPSHYSFITKIFVLLGLYVYLYRF